MGESPLQFMSTVGPSELGKLKEKAAECDRLRQQMEALKDDVSQLCIPDHLTLSALTVASVCV